MSCELPPSTPPTTTDLKADKAARLAASTVILLAAILYSWNLGEAPVYLGWDEARTALQGYALATTGRDMNGNLMPLFFHITDPLIPNHSSVTWWQPLLFYLTAGAVLVAPLAQWSVRLPNVGLALLNVCLIYVIARRLFASRWHAVIATGLLAITPAHFFFARLAQDYFCSQTFVLLWLWCLTRFLQTGNAWLPAAAGAALGAGLYTHISSWIVMPFFFIVTHIALWVVGRPRRANLALTLGFATMLLPLMLWLWWHPSLFRDMFQNYAVVTTPNLAERVSLYWDYFNPSYLFFAGGSDPMWSTRRAGVFLLAAAVLLPFGIWSILRYTTSISRVLLLIGFFFAPVPIVAALPEAPAYAVARDLLVVPFGTLISVAGAEFLFDHRGRIGRLVTMLLLAGSPVQFTLFASDYFTDYQRRSFFRHDHLNTRGVAEYVIASDAAARVPAVYLSDDIVTGKAVQLKFHLTTLGRLDLWDRTKYVTVARFDPSQIPSGSLLVLNVNDDRIRDLTGRGRCTVAHLVHDLTDSPSAAILRKN